MKKEIRKIGTGMIMILVSLSLVGCQFGINKDSFKQSEEIVIEEVKEVENIRTEVREKHWKFVSADLSIDGKPILDYTYREITEKFGVPKEIKSYTQSVGLSETNTYTHIAVFEGLELGFIDDTEGVISDEKTPQTFELTGENRVLDSGLYVGMSVEDVLKKYGGIIYQKEEFTEHIKKIIQDNHKDYDNFRYTQAIPFYHDITMEMETGNFTATMGLVLFIQDEKVECIMMGYPTAG